MGIYKILSPIIQSLKIFLKKWEIRLMVLTSYDLNVLALVQFPEILFYIQWLCNFATFMTKCGFIFMPLKGFFQSAVGVGRSDLCVLILFWFCFYWGGEGTGEVVVEGESFQKNGHCQEKLIVFCFNSYSSHFFP